MEERYQAPTQNWFYPDMSNVNKNITEEAKLLSAHLRIKRTCTCGINKRLPLQQLGLSCNTYTPIEIQMCQLVTESLKFVRIKSHIITDHIV